MEGHTSCAQRHAQSRLAHHARGRERGVIRQQLAAVRETLGVRREAALALQRAARSGRAGGDSGSQPPRAAPWTWPLLQRCARCGKRRGRGRASRTRFKQAPVAAEDTSRHSTPPGEETKRWSMTMETQGG